MNKNEIVKQISERTNLSKKDAEAFLGSFCDVVSSELSAGRTVRITGFGSFEVHERAEKKGHDPRTGKPLVIKSGRAPFFRCSKTLKDRVNN